jgi:hypothetical protein
MTEGLGLFVSEFRKRPQARFRLPPNIVTGAYHQQ